MVQVVSLGREGFILPMVAPCLELWGKLAGFLFSVQDLSMHGPGKAGMSEDRLSDARCFAVSPFGLG